MFTRLIDKSCTVYNNQLTEKGCRQNSLVHPVPYRTKSVRRFRAVAATTQVGDLCLWEEEVGSCGLGKGKCDTCLRVLLPRKWNCKVMLVCEVKIEVKFIGEERVKMVEE